MSQIKFKDLKNKQKKAVKNFDKPVTVFAGPGSGKTTVLRIRYEYLVEEKGINPNDILVTTFNREAAYEIQERIDLEKNLNVSTLHGVFYRILRSDYELFGFDETPVPEDDRSKDIVEDLVKEKLVNGSDLDEKKISDTAKAIDLEISNIKEELRDLDKVEAKIKNGEFSWDILVSGKDFDLIDGFEENLVDIYSDYNEELKNRNIVDFSSMIYFVYDKINSSKELLENYDGLFNAVMVDEAQDLNRLQYESVKLVSDDVNIFLIGDDCQNIYTWRGADHKLMHEFEDEYDADRIVLDSNFRSSKQLVDASNSFNRVLGDGVVNKRMVSDKGTVEESRLHPIVQGYESIHDEGRELAGKIDYLVSNYGYNPEDIAVLSRNTSGQGYIRNQIVKQGIPVNHERDKNFLDKEEVEFVLDFLKFSINDDELFARDLVLNHVSNIGEKKYEKVIDNKKDDERFINFIRRLSEETDSRVSSIDGVGPAILNRLLKFVDFVDSLGKKSNPVQYLVDVSPEWINTDVKRTDEIQILEQKIEGSKDYVDDLGLFFEEIIGSIAVEEDAGVTITTLFGSKGREWDVVFMPYLVEGVLPNYYASDDEEVEEEKRIFYVGITRAKEKLFLSYHLNSFSDDEEEKSGLLDRFEDFI